MVINLNERFSYKYDNIIAKGLLFDNEYQTFYNIFDSEENIRVLCERLNNIVLKNKELLLDLETQEILLKDTVKYNEICLGETEEELSVLRKENKDLTDKLKKYNGNWQQIVASCPSGRFKRLSSSIDYYYCIDSKNKDKGLTVEDMFTMLNNLAEENEELLTINNKKKGALVKAVNQLNKENEELKQEISELGSIHAEEMSKVEDELYEEINQLNDENNELKKKNKRLNYHLNETEKELKEYKDFMSLGGL